MPLSEEQMKIEGDGDAFAIQTQDRTFDAGFHDEDASSPSRQSYSPSPDEPYQFGLLRESDRDLLKKAEAEVLNRHVAGEMAGAIVGAMICLVARRRHGIGALAKRDFGIRPGMPNPPFVKYWSTDYPGMAAAGLVVGRLTANREGWRRGQEILSAQSEASERIRKTFDAKDEQDLIRTYRIAWYRSKNYPEWLTKIMYHFAYLSW